jgi:hypothetical protein
MNRFFNYRSCLRRGKYPFETGNIQGSISSVQLSGSPADFTLAFRFACITGQTVLNLKFLCKHRTPFAVQIKKLDAQVMHAGLKIRSLNFGDKMERTDRLVKIHPEHILIIFNEPVAVSLHKIFLVRPGRRHPVEKAAQRTAPPAGFVTEPDMKGVKPRRAFRQHYIDPSHPSCMIPPPSLIQVSATAVTPEFSWSLLNQYWYCLILFSAAGETGIL